MSKYKTCQSCGKIKTIRCFYKNSHKPDGLHSVCKDCHKKHVKTWISKNRDKHNSYTKNWGKKNIQLVRAYAKKSYRKETKFGVDPRTLKNIIRHNQKRSYLLPLLGTTAANARKHIENNFQKNMNWSNYGGKTGWVLTFKKYPKEFNDNEREQAYHYTNIIPLWKYESDRKPFK